MHDFTENPHVLPTRPILAGRRLSGPEHIIQAAKALGLLNDSLRAELGEEVAHGAE